MSLPVRGPEDSSAAILARLLHLHPKAIDLSLDRILCLLERMGSPHLHLPPVIHVAGTNGKGSTTAFMRAMLESAGLNVHVYTSPHLQRFHERIRIAGALISEEELCQRLLECERVNAGDPITFFEITTTAAFSAFANTHADVTLLEVGLGGRYDTTNAIRHAAVTVITPVDLDHQEFLGHTLAEIAREKAGIIKPQTPLILGPQKDGAEQAILACAAELGAPVLQYGHDWTTRGENGRMVFQYTDGLLDLPLPGLSGPHQLINAGMAVAAVLALPDFRIGADAIAQGLQAVEWPARLQRLCAGRLESLLPAGAELWLDGGHNPAAGLALADALGGFEERRPMPLYLICGMLKTKDARGFLTPFQGLARKIYTLAIPGEQSSLSADALAAEVRGAGLTAESAPDLITALQAITLECGQPPRVVICGSLYLAGAALNADAA
ncbi:MAG TPA: bifunctional folylpolyglutamate synthase/dihydrofolate synthase [Alphaproteobacteria bacterium]|nr:bifunctional folylpolyglutamate synthase/dihydrofolate synthase [Alphaproteobacteria bacterium]